MFDIKNCEQDFNMSLKPAQCMKKAKTYLRLYNMFVKKQFYTYKAEDCIERSYYFYQLAKQKEQEQKNIIKNAKTKMTIMLKNEKLRALETISFEEYQKRGKKK